MAIVELFHERERKRLAGDAPDVYRYDELPRPLRNQIIHICREAIGPFTHPASPSSKLWEAAYKQILRETGRLGLGSFAELAHHAGIEIEYFLSEGPADEVLSLVELLFTSINTRIRSSRLGTYNTTQNADDAIHELNYRFRQHSIGYSFEAKSNRIVRVDSEYVHSEVVRGALRLLSGGEFAGVNDEFLKAHEHYRAGRNKEAMNEALKSFESVMKTVCERRGIPIVRAQARDLIHLLLSQGVLPRTMETHLSGLRTALEAGLPTLRNTQAGHGQGAEVTEVPDHLAAHALHLAASNIVLIVEAHRATWPSSAKRVSTSAASRPQASLTPPPPELTAASRRRPKAPKVPR